MDLHLRKHTAIITGGDSGIGLATAKMLAEEGVNLLLVGKTQKKLGKAKEEIQKLASGNASIISITADLRKNNEVLKIAEKAKEVFENVDIVVHCAGIHGASGDFISLTDADWMESIDMDLMSAVRICRAFLPQMIEKKWGRIVLIASENALQPYEHESPYNACKAAIINLTKCLSRAYSPQGVMINCASPAFIATPMTDAMMKQKAKKQQVSKEEAIQKFLITDRPNIVVNRRGRPEEVASVIAFLCSEHASYITGSNYRVDGGSVSTAFG